MSVRHPIIAVTGSSGAGTSSTRPLFGRMFEKLGLRAAYVEGDSFHVHNREQMEAILHRSRIRGETYSHFGPAANHWDRLEELFRQYGKDGTGSTRRYLHSEKDAEEAGQPPGTFTEWTPLEEGTDVLFYEGLHGAVVTEEYDIASHVDLLIGMTPTINLEWIQKISRDTRERGYDTEFVTRTILRRMPDYVTYITPQFSRTDVNFQRVPLVDTSNPFHPTEVPAPTESLLVIHLNDGSRLSVEFDELLADLPGAFLSRANTLVVPGEKMSAAMELVLMPGLARMVKEKAARQAKGAKKKKTSP